MTETHTRTLARTLSYRFAALAITALWTGLGQAIAIHIVLAVLHYVMERVWIRINWGKFQVDKMAKWLYNTLIN